ncbi:MULTISPECIES: hypothetical protein [unclassified Streptomyces]|uniref:hypothetical protein n=1 Tax=unclassified Streptomyces TaxID=2593676 RepID=UPI0022376D5E|nr:hypothetical protein [Streptomyces sp. SHP 1-2]MCW5253122.1 hypothetical protein [Streptomyces sp. SHP 1-2]
MSMSLAPAVLTETGALTESDPGVALPTLAPVAATPVVAITALGVAGAGFVAGYMAGRAAGSDTRLPM